jgi:hypothetical protein
MSTVIRRGCLARSSALPKPAPVTGYAAHLSASRAIARVASFVPKVRDVFDHTDQLNLRDFRLLKLGRHFRIGPRTKMIITRNEAENNLLEAAVQQGEVIMRWLEGGSPAGAVLGPVDDDLLTIAAKLLLRYTKAPLNRDCLMLTIIDSAEQRFLCQNTFTEEAIDHYRIGTP